MRITGYQPQRAKEGNAPIMLPKGGSGASGPVDSRKKNTQIHLLEQRIEWLELKNKKIRDRNTK